MSNRLLYLHTIDGAPAYFDGERINYCLDLRYGPNTLALSEGQIRDEQERHRRSREDAGVGPLGEHGFIRLRMAPYNESVRDPSRHYLHLLEIRPGIVRVAVFDGQRIGLSVESGGAIRLANSPQQIHSEQEIDRASRSGAGEPAASRYRYLVVSDPSPSD